MKFCVNELTIIVGFYTKLYKQKCKCFDNSACFPFDQNLPEEISLPESSVPQALDHDARLYILKQEQLKVSAECLWKRSEPLISEQLLYSYSSICVPSSIRA